MLDCPPPHEAKHLPAFLPRRQTCHAILERCLLRSQREHPLLIMTHRRHVIHMRRSHHSSTDIHSLLRQHRVQGLWLGTSLHSFLDIFPLSQLDHVRCLHASWYGGQPARRDQATVHEGKKKKLLSYAYKTNLNYGKILKLAFGLVPVQTGLH